MNSEPTDDEIKQAIGSWGNCQITAVIRNVLSNAHRGIKTPYVRKRLEKLEKEGVIVRVPGIYAKQITWALAKSEEACS